MSGGASAAVLAAAAGVALVWLGWLSQRRRLLLALAGYLVAATSTLLWPAPSSGEQRIGLSLLSAMPAALVVLAVQALREKPRDKAPRERPAGRPPASGQRPADRRAALLLAVLYGPVAGFSTLGLCAGLFAMLRVAGAGGSGSVAGTMLAFPLTWGVLTCLGALGRNGPQAVAITLAPGLVGASSLLLL